VEVFELPSHGVPSPEVEPEVKLRPLVSSMSFVPSIQVGIYDKKVIQEERQP
jgi:hypothetical protein